jgi:glycosyltransferase involved in cell wall biosynthesis
VSAPILLDLSHASHTRARTGVQRVARALRRELAGNAVAVSFDPYERAWRPLEKWEEDNLSATEPSPGRGAKWPLLARMRGTMRRVSQRPSPLAAVTATGGVIVPEIFSPAVAAALPGLFSASAGPHVALFHDAIALRLPEITPSSTVARFPGYLQDLLLFDGVVAVSEDSRESLEEYWRWLGVSKVPAVAAIPLGVDPSPPGAGLSPSLSPPTLLCVGTIEARKNHHALLEACEALWEQGADFRLRLVGMANAETGAGALGLIDLLRSKGRPVTYDGALNEAELEAAYLDCAFTVYPSLAEGFGLPVAESLSRGKPCLCRFAGALGEIARGGGCVDLGAAAPAEISSAIKWVLGSPRELSALCDAARARRFKNWAEYSAEILAWMAGLPRRA